MPPRTDYEREIESLHDFFTKWYCGECERRAFETVERALADSFERVTPDGTIDKRRDVLEGIRRAYDTYEGGAFEIEIRNVEPVETKGDRALVRYEEWQTSVSGTNGRLSTAQFAPIGKDEENGLEWRYLHETWLDSPE